LTKIRQRYGVVVFHRFFEALVEQCQAAGLVWGKELYIAATKVVAAASVASIVPRFAVAARAQVEDLFVQDADAAGPPGPCADTSGLAAPSAIGPAVGTDIDGEELAQAKAARHAWIAAVGRQDRTRGAPRYQRTADFAVSTTDPDATPLRQRDGVRLGYQDHYGADGGSARIILAVLVAAAEVPEDHPAADLLWYARFRWQLWPGQARPRATKRTAPFRSSGPWRTRGSGPIVPCPPLRAAAPMSASWPFAMTRAPLPTAAQAGAPCRLIAGTRPSSWSCTGPTPPPAPPAHSRSAARPAFRAAR
jgi:hypothetical protein